VKGRWNLPSRSLTGSRIHASRQMAHESLSWPFRRRGKAKSGLCLEHCARTRLPSRGQVSRPVWEPNGRRVTVQSAGQLVSVPAVGGGESTLLLAPDADATVLFPLAWSRTGGVLAYSRPVPTTGRDIWTVQPGEPPKPICGHSTRRTFGDVFAGRSLDRLCGNGGGPRRADLCAALSRPWRSRRDFPRWRQRAGMVSDRARDLLPFARWPSHDGRGRGHETGFHRQSGRASCSSSRAASGRRRAPSGRITTSRQTASAS
jgi:hypothetical protein